MLLPGSTRVPGYPFTTLATVLKSDKEQSRLLVSAFPSLATKVTSAQWMGLLVLSLNGWADPHLIHYGPFPQIQTFSHPEVISDTGQEQVQQSYHTMYHLQIGTKTVIR